MEEWMAEEEGRMELNEEEEDEYYLWLREQEEEEGKEEATSEEESIEGGEEELKDVGGEEEAWGYNFGSPTTDEVGAWASGGTRIDWDKAYDEMVEEYVGQEDEVEWEMDSMGDGEEYLDQDCEDGELIYDRRKPISTDHLFELR
ncbi:unnamed protein product [Closterium sp. Yama58-4]|nr:unnamed protein product [Closterium sp. Yama58-4]